MIIKTVSYGFTKNLGNYQSERLDVTAELDHNDDVAESIDILKAIVEAELKLKTEPKAPS
ncbi:MAG: hypothetical protein HC827_11985 [Cyanobacteria bacterium RM1_2_2]|nr:hypothetical protein [Cyanobacteria bacterium RM1_2_2]